MFPTSESCLAPLSFHTNDMAELALTDVDGDVLVDIFLQLSVKDLLRVRQTCRYLYDLTHTKNVWVHILRRDLISARLPFPSCCRPVRDLTGPQLEALLSHALCLERDILQPPERRSLHIVPLHQKRSVTWVKLVRAQWLVVAASDASVSVLSIWSLASLLDSRGSQGLLSEIHLSGPVRGAILDLADDRDGRDDQVIVALDICSPQPSIQVFQLFGDGAGVPTFSHLVTLDDAAHLRALRGATICFALHHELSVPCVWDWQRNVVVRLCDQPDPLGGCMAMDIWDNFVAVVTPERLQLFNTLNDTEMAVRKTLLEFRGEVSFADVVFSSRPSDGATDGTGASTPMIHLCICDYLGLHVFRLLDVSSELQHFYDVRRWSSPLPLVADPAFMPYEVAPRFGPGCTSVSWINAFEVGKGAYTFANGRLPAVGARAPRWQRTPDDGPCFRLAAPHMPALYFHAVRDLDEALGLLVAGNAFGELVLCRFGGSALRELDGCFQEVRLPTIKNGLPFQTTTQSTPAPPFPYAGPHRLSDASAQTLLATWKAHPPAQRANDDAAHDWQTPASLAPPLDPLWHDLFLARHGRAARLLHARHYLGTPVPLLFDRARTRVVLSVGGVRFVWCPHHDHDGDA
ncbi:uncharacterized protein PHACADRAFT_203235, partial [Phanerochaete carnosa HHB-10118-sp]